MHTKPDRSEAAEYYFKYIDLVPEGNIIQILDTQLVEAVAQFRAISEEASRQRYAPDKWSIRQLLGHVNDAERVFVFRAFWFARGFGGPLPSFDQDVAATQSAAEHRLWDNLIHEFASIRRASLTCFGSLTDAAWMRRGVASDNPVTVRALAYITAGHVAHHLGVLRSHYL